MSDESRVFKIESEDRNVLSSKVIEVSSMVATTGEYEFVVPNRHLFAISPNRKTIIPTSYDSMRVKDFVWAGETFGYLPPGMKQSGAVLEAAKTTIVMISTDFFSDVLKDAVDISRVDFTNIVAVEDQVSASIIGSLDKVARLGGDEAWPMLAEALGSAMVVRIIQQLGAQPKFAEIPYREGLSGHRLRRVLEYIDDNLSSHMRLSDLASVAAISQFHFSRAFKKAMNASPVQYLWERRINRAKKLLKTTEVPLAIISYQCGFSSQSHFTTLFKRQVGVTPSAYRSQMR